MKVNSFDMAEQGFKSCNPTAALGAMALCFMTKGNI